MKIFFISIFPEIFENFMQTSLIQKAGEKGILEFELINPRQFCHDKHRQIDDTIYGGGAGMLMMAQPIIDAINFAVKKISNDFHIIFPSPSKEIWNQKHAYSFSKYENLIFVCGRYEGIDYRFEQYCLQNFSNKFSKISLGKFITLGGELPTMTMVESITRLIPGVIGEVTSWQDESYQIQQNMENLEYPQYTRPKSLEGLDVPDVLLNGNHKEILNRRQQNSHK